MGKYAKAAVAVLAAGALALQAALSDNTVTPSEWITIGLAALGAVGVYAIENKPADGSAP